MIYPLRIGGPRLGSVLCVGIYISAYLQSLKLRLGAVYISLGYQHNGSPKPLVQETK